MNNTPSPFCKVWYSVVILRNVNERVPDNRIPARGTYESWLAFAGHVYLKLLEPTGKVPESPDLGFSLRRTDSVVDHSMKMQPRSRRRTSSGLVITERVKLLLS